MRASELSVEIANERWFTVISLVKQYPKKATIKSRRVGFFDGKTDASVLPLHEAIVGNAPYECIEALAVAYPAALKQTETSFNRLPLHCACRKHDDPKVAAYLVDLYAEACLIPDSLGRLPIFYALSNGSNPDVVRPLMHACPSVARGLDHRYWTPLAVACNVGASAEVVKLLLKAYPEAVLIRTKNGSSPSRCIPKQCPHRNELKALLSETKEMVNETITLPTMRKDVFWFDNLQLV